MLKCYFYPRPPRGGRPEQLKDKETSMSFLSTPSARRATRAASRPQRTISFLSTPSARRATLADIMKLDTETISIHALREEGDGTFHGASRNTPYFYPRPPRGGRLDATGFWIDDVRFLSTPSARRATCDMSVGEQAIKFLSTPSARRATNSGTMLRTMLCDFYPRPPRGGRPFRSAFSCVEP